MIHHQYIPTGVCSRLIDIDLDEQGTIARIQVTGGCHGNLQGIASLLHGMKPADAIARLKGIRCGNKPTSCPDQIATALETIQQQ